MPQDKFRKETFSLALYLMKTKREFRSSHFIHFTLSYLFLFSTAVSVWWISASVRAGGGGPQYLVPVTRPRWKYLWTILYRNNIPIYEYVSCNIKSQPPDLVGKQWRLTLCWKYEWCGVSLFNYNFESLILRKTSALVVIASHYSAPIHYNFCPKSIQLKSLSEKKTPKYIDHIAGQYCFLRNSVKVQSVYLQCTGVVRHKKITTDKTLL